VSYLSQTVTKELHVYAGASEKAIAAVAYLRTLDKDGNPDLGFVLGKAKVTGSSQSNVLDVSFRKISFPWIITGAKNPRGSYILLTVDSIPRRVTGLLSNNSASGTLCRCTGRRNRSVL
jgi:hypothetical protein